MPLEDDAAGVAPMWIILVPVSACCRLLVSATEWNSPRRIVAAQDRSGYFQVIAEPVSTWVQEILRARAAAVAALGDEVVDAARPSCRPGTSSARSRYLIWRRQRDQFDHRGVQLVLVAHRRGAAFEVADGRAFLGDDQRALELAGVGR